MHYRLLHCIKFLLIVREQTNSPYDVNSWGKNALIVPFKFDSSRKNDEILFFTGFLSLFLLFLALAPLVLIPVYAVYTIERTTRS